MKTLGLVIVLFFGSLFQATAQSKNFESTSLASKPAITFMNTLDDYSYQFNLTSIDVTPFLLAFNVRVEDELTSEDKYQLLKQVSFFDVQLSYTFTGFEFQLTVENLLGINNNNFAIEPNLERGIGAMENILFTHEADFLVSARIAYNFN
jgi:hypothetical protein